MARHADIFARCGITTKTLESASRARQAFHQSGWEGARMLIRADSQGRHERTPLFETIIKRGLSKGTRFDIDTISAREQATLGITFDSSLDKYVLSQFTNGFDESTLPPPPSTSPVLAAPRPTRPSLPEVPPSPVPSSPSPQMVDSFQLGVDAQLPEEESGSGSDGNGLRTSLRRKRRFLRERPKLRVEVSAARKPRPKVTVSAGPSTATAPSVVTQSPRDGAYEAAPAADALPRRGSHIDVLQSHIQELLKEELQQGLSFHVSKRTTNGTRSVQVIIELIADDAGGGALLVPQPCDSAAAQWSRVDYDHAMHGSSSGGGGDGAFGLPPAKRPRITVSASTGGDAPAPAAYPLHDSFDIVAADQPAALGGSSASTDFHHAVAASLPWTTDGPAFFDTLDLEALGVGLF
eukprot:TRINITY_DN3471_c0_g1_i1.p1 TRINITY_DN3471_c0_g1~~TRINITY_DN3471_c0_g1_i1.p1  ORF type:complete len:426 (-),score=124.11 TRINITY_DN3471_c0_g1_i1:125-1348(-)